jgi:hypothetical protein
MSQRINRAEPDISIEIEDLLGPLGYSDADSVKPAIMDQILSEMERCREAVAGKAVYSLLEFSRLPARNVIEIEGETIEDATLVTALDGAKALAVAVCTVGPKIDKIVEDHFDGGDYLRGMIADVVGNRAVESVAHNSASLICSEARTLDLSTARQISPGYGKWDTSGQRPVFKMLDPSPIGVSLNDQCMMEPKKSISFVTPLVEGEAQPDDRPPCHGCDFKNCSYRRK